MKIPVPPHPRKKLGQNFLIDSNIVDKILSFFQPSPDDVVLEIGSGTGALTVPISASVRKLYAVEIDQSLIPYLERIPHVTLIQRDVLEVDFCNVEPGIPLRITGNLPYYISTSIFTRLLASRNCLKDMVLMFQNEVAVRILSSPSDPDYSFLSVLAQYFCKIERGFKIGRNSFFPKPEIDSRILHFTFRRDTRLEFDEYRSFLAVAFSHRRKKLRNNLLRGTAGISADRLNAAYQSLGIEETVRAENLSPLQFEQMILALR